MRLLLVAAFLVPVPFASGQAGAPRPPLNQAEVVLLLRSGVSPARVASLVRKLGIDFVVDNAAVDLLRVAGADQGLIDQLRGATAAPRSTAEPPSSTPAGAHERPSPRTAAPASPTPSPTSLERDFATVPGRDGVYIARREVTRGEYLDYCARWKQRRPKDPPVAKARPDYPVVNVTWEEAVAYCRRLSQETKRAYRLPTEAEWELSASGGNPHRTYPWRDGDDPRMHACFGGNDLCRVGSRRPNDLGLYDMAGNAAEWVKGKDGKPVAKGGSWATSPERVPDLAIARRVGFGPRKPSYEVGFRLALGP